MGKPVYKFLKKGDLKFAKLISEGWVAYRDYNGSIVYKGKDILRISKQCYRRLAAEGLAEV